jgi:hypothetical protein
MKYTPRLPVSEVNVIPRSPLKEFVLLAGALTGIAVGIFSERSPHPRTRAASGTTFHRTRKTSAAFPISRR